MPAMPTLPYHPGHAHRGHSGCYTALIFKRSINNLWHRCCKESNVFCTVASSSPFYEETQAVTIRPNTTKLSVVIAWIDLKGPPPPDYTKASSKGSNLFCFQYVYFPSATGGFSSFRQEQPGQTLSCVVICFVLDGRWVCGRYFGDTCPCDLSPNYPNPSSEF